MEHDGIIKIIHVSDKLILTVDVPYTRIHSHRTKIYVDRHYGMRFALLEVNQNLPEPLLGDVRLYTVSTRRGELDWFKTLQENEVVDQDVLEIVRAPALIRIP